MNKAYENMRNFWLDVKNLENRKGIMELGADKISVAGVKCRCRTETKPNICWWLPTRWGIAVCILKITAKAVWAE